MSILRIACYERVSTEEQAKLGSSIQTQVDALTEHCEKNGYRIVDHYTDEGVSGGKPALKRPEMARLIEDIKAGRVDVVLFTHLDRWFRNTKEYFKVQDILDKHNVKWKAIMEQYDTTTAQGEMVVTMALGFAQHFRQQTSEKIKRTFENKIKNKECYFGWNQIPWGYIREKDKDGIPRMVKDPEKKEMVQEFWDVLVKWQNTDKAARHINEKYGLSKPRSSWTNIINNPHYCGIHKDVDDYCEPYVSPEDFLALQQRKTIRKTQNNRVYLFTGLLICPHCGRTLKSTYQTQKSGEYYSYRCVGKRTGACDYSRNISELKVEKYLLDNLQEFIRDEIARVEIEESKPKNKVKSKVPALKEKLRRLNVMYMAGTKSDEEFLKESKELNKQIREAEMENPEEKPKDLTSIKALLETDIKGVYETLTRENKQRFWRSIISEIPVEGNKPKPPVFLI